MIGTVEKSTLFDDDPKIDTASPPRRGPCQQRRRPASCDMLPGPEILYCVEMGYPSIKLPFYSSYMFILYHPESGYPKFDIPLINSLWDTHKYKRVSQTFISIFFLIPWGFPVFRGTGSHTQMECQYREAPDLDRLKTWLGHPRTW